MIGNILRGMQSSEWSHFIDYLSPVFFEVVPVLDIATQTSQLGKTFMRLKHQAEESALRDLIQQFRLPVNFRESRTSSEMLTSLSKTQKGRIVLSLYLAQIMNLPFAWLDLRSKTFEYLSRECNWTPAAWIMHWDETFLSALRKIYRGHFSGDDGLYRQGLQNLGLEHAAEAFRAHLDPLSASAPFRLKDFRESFHQIFLSSKEARTTLHPNFFALGFMLGSLYENLESLGGSYDMKKVFLSIQQF
jgi:hypothetical protein